MLQNVLNFIFTFVSHSLNLHTARPKSSLDCS